MIGKKHGAVEREHYAPFRPAVCNGDTARLGALFISRDYLASIHRARGKETQKFQGGPVDPMVLRQGLQNHGPGTRWIS